MEVSIGWAQTVRTLTSTRFKPLAFKLCQKRQLTELLAHHIETYLWMMGSESGWVFDLDVDRAGIVIGSLYMMGTYSQNTNIDKIQAARI